MNNTSDSKEPQVRISLQLSEKCNALTLGAEFLGLIQKLNSCSPQVLKGTFEVCHNGNEMKMEFGTSEDAAPYNDIYANY